MTRHPSRAPLTLAPLQPGPLQPARAGVRPPGPRARLMAPLLAALAVTGCAEGFDFDFRSSPIADADASRRPTEPRPPVDERGVISYPGYQVAVAQRGDTPATIAGRLGIPAPELASFNGLPEGVVLSGGEVLALPRRVAEPSGGGPIAPGSVDIATLAGAAIDRASGTEGPPAISGRQPIRHEVARGETAYTIARAYDIPVRALAEWNGLGPDLEVREGQFLMIPVVQGVSAEAEVAAAPSEGAIDATPPGVGSRVPEPPSAATPLPEPEPEATPEIVAEAEAATPDLSEDRTEASGDARLRAPVSGAVVRAFEAGVNEGVDFAADAGTPVAAAAGGTVAAITEDTDGVPILVLRHAGSLLTVYANIGDLSVQKGDTVSAGQTIATVREGGILHFEVREGFEAADPVEYLD